MAETFEWTHHHSFDWESNLVAHIYYNHVFSELWVVLRGGRTYAYNAVSQAEYNAFTNAVSPGRYYNTNIRQNRDVYSIGFKGYDYDIKFVSPKAVSADKQFEVTVQVTLTTKVTVSAASFDSAEKLGLEEVDKLYSSDMLTVTAIEAK